MTGNAGVARYTKITSVNRRRSSSALRGSKHGNDGSELVRAENAMVDWAGVGDAYWWELTPRAQDSDVLQLDLEIEQMWFRQLGGEIFLQSRLN